MGVFVPEKPEAYERREVAASASYHFEFQHNRTAVKVSIPNGLLGPDDPHTEAEACMLIGVAAYKAAREAKG
jgi:hypothetical protein